MMSRAHHSSQRVPASSKIVNPPVMISPEVEQCSTAKLRTNRRRARLMMSSSMPVKLRLSRECVGHANVVKDTEKRGPFHKPAVESERKY